MSEETKCPICTDPQFRNKCDNCMWFVMTPQGDVDCIRNGDYTHDCDMFYSTDVSILIEFIRNISPAWLPKTFRNIRHELIKKYKRHCDKYFDESDTKPEIITNVVNTIVQVLERGDKHARTDLLHSNGKKYKITMERYDEPINLNDEAFDRLVTTMKQPPKPSEQLKKAMKRYRKEK